MDLLPISSLILDKDTKELITKYFLPRWFVGSDSQIVTYITSLKKETYQLPEVKQFILELGIKLEELLKDPYPYFMAIRWDWNLWSDLLTCESNRDAVMANLRGKSIKDIDDIVCQKRPSTVISDVVQILQKRGEKYLDIDIFVYRDKPKKLVEPDWGITSDSEYRFYAMLSGLELSTVLEVLKNLNSDEYYVVETKEIIFQDKLESYRHRAPWFKICSNDFGRYNNLYNLLSQFHR